MQYAGLSLEDAADSVIYGRLEPIGGDGGIIAVDHQGNVSMPFNTSSMIRGFVNADGDRGVYIFKDEE